jgi:hypothetical protein
LVWKQSKKPRKKKILQKRVVSIESVLPKISWNIVSLPSAKAVYNIELFIEFEHTLKWINKALNRKKAILVNHSRTEQTEIDDF